MDSLAKGWFSELGPLWPGQCFSMQYEKVIFQGKSKFQDILVFDTKTYGRVLVLDGVIQLTERDECSYQEMMTHIPMTAHSQPRSVLIIGGGDGGVLREVVKHECVEEAHLVDIDEMVIQVSKDYLPQTAVGFSSPKATMHIADGFEFLKSHVEKFDVIICDSSDPVGPAESLFEESFFQLAMNALKPEGILCTQCESMWIHLPIIKKSLDSLRKFASVEYAWTSVPSYPTGAIGFALARKGPSKLSCKHPVRDWTHSSLKYYTPELHAAAFSLPRFVSEALGES